MGQPRNVSIGRGGRWSCYPPRRSCGGEFDFRFDSLCTCHMSIGRPSVCSSTRPPIRPAEFSAAAIIVPDFQFRNLIFMRRIHYATGPSTSRPEPNNIFFQIVGRNVAFAFYWSRSSLVPLITLTLIYPSPSLGWSRYLFLLCFLFVSLFHHQCIARCNTILECRLLCRGGLGVFLLQIHPGRILVGCRDDDDSGLRGHEVLSINQLRLVQQNYSSHTHRSSSLCCQFKFQGKRGTNRSARADLSFSFTRTKKILIQRFLFLSTNLF